jgi:hypothetical protein
MDYTSKMAKISKVTFGKDEKEDYQEQDDES